MLLVCFQEQGLETLLYCTPLDCNAYNVLSKIIDIVLLSSFRCSTLNCEVVVELLSRKLQEHTQIVQMVKLPVVLMLRILFEINSCLCEKIVLMMHNITHFCFLPAEGAVCTGLPDVFRLPLSRPYF